MVEQLFTVEKNYLVNICDKITFETFNHIIGKEIDFYKRIGTKIMTTRQNGHLYVSDYKLIPGERYSKFATRNKKTYVCIASNENTATLEPESNILKVIIVKNPLEYHIL